MINSDSVEFELITDPSNTFDEPADLEFTWSVTEFKARFMKIQIDWAKAYQISAGVERDILQMKLRSNQHFFSG